MAGERYSRQSILPEFGDDGQERLARSTVLVVGCGALGSVLADTLTRGGVGHLENGVDQRPAEAAPEVLGLDVEAAELDYGLVRDGQGPRAERAETDRPTLAVADEHDVHASLC